MHRKRIILSIVIALSSATLLFRSVFADDPTPTPTPGSDSSQQVQDLQNKISDLQNKISGLQSQEKTLSSQIAVMDSQINLTQYKMQTTQAQITSVTRRGQLRNWDSTAYASASYVI
jgi:peptidoglycan hydrolase CwlO-like protein